MPDPSDTMHAVGMFPFGEVESLGVAVGDDVFARSDIHYDGLPIELRLDLRADVALVDIPPPANDLFGCAACGSNRDPILSQPGRRVRKSFEPQASATLYWLRVGTMPIE